MSFSVHKPNISRQSSHIWSKQQESLSDHHLPTCTISIHCVNRSLLHTHVFLLVNSCFGYQPPTCCTAFSSKAFFCSIQTWLTTSRKLQDAKKGLCVCSLSGVNPYPLFLWCFCDLSGCANSFFPPTPHIRASDWDRSTADGSMQSRSHVLKLHLVWELVHTDRLSTDCLCVCVPDTVAACTPTHPQPPPLSVARTQ